MEILRVALIGAGERGVQGYIPILEAMAVQYQFVGIYDIDREAAKSVAQHHGVRAHKDLDSLFAEEIDFVIIAAPAHLNQNLAIEVAQHDVSLLMETPVAVDLPSADQIARITRVHNIKVEVAETYYRRPHEEIKRLLIQEGTFGQINFAYCRFVGHGYHAVSLLRSYIGFEIPPVRVSGFQNDFSVQPHIWPSGRSKHTTIERWQHGVIEFSEGKRGVYDFTSLSYGSPLRWNRAKATTEIYGEKGTCIGLEPICLNGNEETNPIVIKRLTIEVTGVEVLDVYVAETEPQIVWENPFREYPLTDSQIAIASCLTSIANTIREGVEPEYGFSNARTDREIDLALAWSYDHDGTPLDLL